MNGRNVHMKVDYILMIIINLIVVLMKKMSTLYNNSFETNLKGQGMSFSSSFLTPLKECLESAGFKDKLSKQSLRQIH